MIDLMLYNFCHNKEKKGSRKKKGSIKEKSKVVEMENGNNTLSSKLV